MPIETNDTYMSYCSEGNQFKMFFNLYSKTSWNCTLEQVLPIQFKVINISNFLRKINRF